MWLLEETNLVLPCMNLEVRHRLARMRLEAAFT